MKRLWLAMTLLALAGCESDITLKRADGASVTCSGGETFFDDDGNDSRPFQDCIRACEMQGFKREDGFRYADVPHREQPVYMDLKNIPQECLP